MICKHILFIAILEKPELFLHTVKCKVFLSNTNNSIYY